MGADSFEDALGLGTGMTPEVAAAVQSELKRLG
jgi:hypothetical protein